MIVWSPVLEPVEVPLPEGAQTMVAVIPPTVPVNVGEAILAFRFRAVVVAVETGNEATVQSFVALLAETSANIIKSAESIVPSGIHVGNITSAMICLVK